MNQEQINNVRYAQVELPDEEKLDMMKDADLIVIGCSGQGMTAGMIAAMRSAHLHDKKVVVLGASDSNEFAQGLVERHVAEKERCVRITDLSKPEPFGIRSYDRDFVECDAQVTSNRAERRAKERAQKKMNKKARSNGNYAA